MEAGSKKEKLESGEISTKFPLVFTFLSALDFYISTLPLFFSSAFYADYVVGSKKI